jgi:hypothetical protein
MADPEGFNLDTACDILWLLTQAEGRSKRLEQTLLRPYLVVRPTEPKGRTMTMEGTGDALAMRPVVHARRLMEFGRKTILTDPHSLRSVASTGASPCS